MAFWIMPSGSLVGYGADVPEPGWYLRRRLVDVGQPDKRSKWRAVEVGGAIHVWCDRTALYEWRWIEKPPD